jgi:hypothetical protein
VSAEAKRSVPGFGCWSRLIIIALMIIIRLIITLIIMALVITLMIITVKAYSLVLRTKLSSRQSCVNYQSSTANCWQKQSDPALFPVDYVEVS